MWLLTKVGFFSIVEKPEDREPGLLTVRARVKEDLAVLRERYLPELGPVEESLETDYRYRARAPHAAVSVGISRAVADIDYSNFKNVVSQEQGPDRAKLYGKVWSVLYTLQPTGAPFVETEPFPAISKTIAKASSYGGVMVDRDGRILLREPTGHYDGYVWTFAKGRPEKGDTAELTARREVREELGYEGEIVDILPGVFKGGTGTTAFFVMQPIGKQGKTDLETQSTRWVQFSEAEALIGQTVNMIGRKRDQEVLAAAREWYLKKMQPPFRWQGLEIQDMPEKNVAVELDLSFDSKEVVALKMGRIPQSDDDKWFARFAKETLYIHRSSSGVCFFKIHFEFSTDRAQVKGVQINRDPEQRVVGSIEEDLGLLKAGLDEVLYSNLEKIS